MFTTARRRAFDESRRRKRRRAADEGRETTSPNTGADPEDTAELALEHLQTRRLMTEGGEQESIMHLFGGAIGTFKNPSSHRTVSYDDPTLAAEAVLLADLLLRLLSRLKKS